MSSVPLLKSGTLLTVDGVYIPASVVADPTQSPVSAHAALSAVRHFFDTRVWPAVASKFVAIGQHEVFVRWLAHPKLVMVDHWAVNHWVQLAERDAALP